MQKLFIVRGVSGAGKTTFAEAICDIVVSADDYFMQPDGSCQFDPKLLPKAHAYCQDNVRKHLSEGRSVAVANTFTRQWEMQPYLNMAAQMGVMTFSTIVENRHGGQNAHGVPDEVVQGMKDRFEIKL